MYILINLFILAIILFLYIHIYFHIKKSNYLEIYEVENLSKEKLEELCDLKQPIIINNLDITNSLTIESIKNSYARFDINLVNMSNSSDSLSIPINLSDSIDLFNKDISCMYISYNNFDFLEETTLNKNFKNNDLFLRPYTISNIYYDIIFGSVNSYTNLNYNLNYRNFFYINSGSIEITLCPPKNHKYLYVKDANDNLEYISKIDINNVDESYKKEFDKIKLLRIVIIKGQTIQIPAYWFYSLKILEKDTLISSYKYRTFMNNVAILPQLAVKFMQDNNIKRNFTKIIN
jgi:hypothetical protein